MHQRPSATVQDSGTVRFETIMDNDLPQKWANAIISGEFKFSDES